MVATQRKATNSRWLELKRNRQFQIVWWEARAVKIWTWPDDVRQTLIHFCILLLQKAFGATSDCEHGYTHGTFRVRPSICGDDDICGACTKTMLAELRMDYKCLDIHLPS